MNHYYFHLHSHSSPDIHAPFHSCRFSLPHFALLCSISRPRTVQRPLFFMHSLSSPNPLTLSSLKALITEVYLKRHDPRIEELTRERRPGRPKPKELLDLEEVKRRETGEYETGMGGFYFLIVFFSLNCNPVWISLQFFLRLSPTFPGPTLVSWFRVPYRITGLVFSMLPSFGGGRPTLTETFLCFWFRLRLL